MMSYLGDLDDLSDTEVVFKDSFRPQSSDTLQGTKRVKTTPVWVARQKPNSERLSTRTSRSKSTIFAETVQPAKQKTHKLPRKAKSVGVVEETHVELGINIDTASQTSPPTKKSVNNGPLKMTTPRQAEKRIAKEETYSVEAIMGKKTVRGVVFYNVKWAGFDATSNSWEPIQNFENLDVIDEYEEYLRQVKTNGKASKAENKPGNVTQPRRKTTHLSIVCNTRDLSQSSFIRAEIEDDTCAFAREFIIPLSGQAALATYERLYRLWQASTEEGKQDSSKKLDLKSVAIRASQTSRKVRKLR